MRAMIEKLFGSFLLAGIIVLLFGIYYMFIKAGLPYQDPPLELLVQWNTYGEVGETLSLWGAVMILASILGTVLMRITRRAPKKQE